MWRASHELDWLLNSREQFLDCKKQLEVSGLTNIQRTARYFQIIKISFGADRKTFGTAKKNLQNSIEYLPEIKERLKNVVEHKDFKYLIKVYDRPNVLSHLDPLYFGTESYSFEELFEQWLRAVLYKTTERTAYQQNGGYPVAQ